MNIDGTVLREAHCGLGSAEVEHLIRKYRTPLYLISEKALEHNYRTFCAELPGVEVFYAIKANPIKEIVETMARLGSGFDAASKNEIEQALRLGTPKEKIIFANPVKRLEGVRFARKVHADFFTYDNPAEITKMARYAPGSSALLRLKVSNKGSLIDLSVKFGTEEEEAIDLIEAGLKAGLRINGLAFHVGSQVKDATGYVAALEMCRRVFDEAKRRGIELTTIDIGGGFPIRSVGNDMHDNFRAIAKDIRDAMARLFSEPIRFLAEPGRFMVGTAATLIVMVIGKTRRAGRPWYYLNDGAYSTLSATLFDHWTFRYLTFRTGTPTVSTLAGPTCDSMDIITHEAMLPDLEVGDFMVIPDAGAYTIASATNFNGFPKAKVIKY